MPVRLGIMDIKQLESILIDRRTLPALEWLGHCGLCVTRLHSPPHTLRQPFNAHFVRLGTSMVLHRGGNIMAQRLHAKKERAWVSGPQFLEPLLVLWREIKKFLHGTTRT